MSEREQRLVFGEVAETYDRVRPGYPEELVDDVMAYAGAAPGSPAVEVGAGTGIATVMFAERGLRITAIEPSSAVARRKLAAFPGVVVEEMLFEDYEPASLACIVYAAQAWHWVPSDVRYAKAQTVLVRGGAFASFWNVPLRYRPGSLRGTLDAQYERLAPDVPTRGPGSGWTTVAADQKVTLGEIEASRLFSDLEASTYDHERTLATPDYVALLETQSDHRLLPEAQRADLLAAITAAIDTAGGRITVEYRTHLYLARRRPI